MDPLSVLMLTPDFPPAHGGIGLIMHRLAAGATRTRVRVVAMDAEDTGGFDDAQPFVVRRAPASVSRQASIGMLNVRSLLEGARFRPDVILSGHIVTSPAAIVLSRALAVPVVQYVFADEVRARPALAKFAVRSAEVTIALSRYARDVVLALGADATCVRTIPPGVDMPDGARSSRATEPTILTVARLVERYKGHDVVMRAMPLIAARAPGVRWVIVGDGPLRRPLEHLGDALGASAHVHFAGSRLFADDATWFDHAHVFAMVSRLGPGGAGGEGFGIVYLEANARGLPVVAGNVAGALDAVVHGETGLLVDPCDHVAVAEAILSLLEQPAHAERLGRAGAERAKDFAWPKIAAQVEDVVLEVAGRRR